MDMQHDETEAIRELLNASNAAARLTARREASQASQERPAAPSRRPALPIPQTRRARMLRALARLATAPELWFVVALALTAGTAHAGGTAPASAPRGAPIGGAAGSTWDITLYPETCKSYTARQSATYTGDMLRGFAARHPGYVGLLNDNTGARNSVVCYNITPAGVRATQFGHEDKNDVIEFELTFIRWANAE